DFAFNPLPCNRLDRLTSGIMFIGKHRRAADDLSTQLKTRAVRKEYVARVAGQFPDGEVVCDKPILQISPKVGLNRVRANGKESRTVFRRLAYYPPREEEQTKDEQTKEEQTKENERGSGADSTAENDEGTDGGMSWKRFRGYSIVRCLPLTGRTHQIR